MFDKVGQFDKVHREMGQFNVGSYLNYAVLWTTIPLQKMCINNSCVGYLTYLAESVVLNPSGEFSLQ